MELMSPSSTDLVLDVGVTDTAWRSSNPLEAAYPWPERITAVGLDQMPTFQKLFPGVKFVVADGRRLPLGTERSRRFLERRHRARRQPDGSASVRERASSDVPPRLHLHPERAFPDRPSHAPSVRALAPAKRPTPDPARNRKRPLGQRVGPAPITPGELRSMFPPEARVRIVRQQFLGLTTVMTAIGGEPPARGE